MILFKYILILVLIIYTVHSQIVSVTESSSILDG